VKSNIQDNLELHLQAPAKINLILRVISRRSDGYHELETWMQKVGLYDTMDVSINGSPGVMVTCSHPEIPDDETNLVWRAADLFFKTSRNARGRGATIHLEKHIPVAAGLGGGSSDAGTLLRGLNTFFGNEFDDTAMIALAASLGADVPFFVIEAQSVLATGVGEKMLPVPAPEDCTYILVNPGFSVSTATIFEKYALTRAVKNSTLTGSQKLSQENLHVSALENDLEAVAVTLYPVIADIKEELKRAGAYHVLMSGSGPTVFGIFPEKSKFPEKTIGDIVHRLRLKFGDKVYRVG